MEFLHDISVEEGGGALLAKGAPVTGESKADAPRFRAYFEHLEGNTVLAMGRSEWEAFRVCENRPVRVDVEQTPLRGLMANTQVKATVAEKLSSATSRIAIYRYDTKDVPTPVNVDTYLVLEDLPSQADYQRIVNAASTEDNENFRRFLGEHVFLLKERPGKDHWLPEVPGSVMAVWRST